MFRGARFRRCNGEGRPVRLYPGEGQYSLHWRPRPAEDLPPATTLLPKVSRGSTARRLSP